MLFYFHGGDILEQLFIFALVIIGFIVIFSIPFIFLIRDIRRDWSEIKEERERKKG
jgi:hypothetical protein